MKRVVPFVLVLFTLFIPVGEALAKVQIYLPGQVVQGYPDRAGVIYWHGSTFYQASDGFIYAPHYNKRVIKDLISYCHYHGMRTFYILPNGYYGSVPSSLKNYFYQSFARAGIQVTTYQPYRYIPSQPRQRHHGHHNQRGHHHSNNGLGLIFQFRF